MISIDLKDAFLQVPIHPSSRKFLRFSAGGRVWQFRVLCFGLTTAPQVFTRVMAPISVWLHQLGVRILRYFDDWLALASSLQEALWARVSPQPLFGAGGDSKLGEVAVDSNPECDSLGNDDRLCDFQGFPNGEKDSQASVNYRRISVLKRAACLLVDDSPGSSLVINLPRSPRQVEVESSSTLPQELVGLP